MRGKRKCELCSNIATVFCGSDQANLCYECDSKVHGANFLVAKHTRTLLCHGCQSLTLWSGSGPKFGPTISVCPTCLSSKNDAPDHSVINCGGDGHGPANDDLGDDHDDDDGDGDDDDGDNGFQDDSENGDDDDDDHEDDEENQVVPWSFSVSHPR